MDNAFTIQVNINQMKKLKFKKTINARLIALLLSVLFLTSCRSNKSDFKKSSIYGYWICTVKSDSTGDMLFDKKHLTEWGRFSDTIQLDYKIKKRKLTISYETTPVTEYDILKLTDDTLILKQRFLKQYVSTYFRKK